jgi:hypothetical protein
VQVTVDLPGEFAAELARVGPSELSEILTFGLSEWRSRRGPQFAGLSGLLERLANLPEPQDVLHLRPTAELTARASELLEKNRAGMLSDKEQEEWQRLELAEHLVRIAKAQAAKKLKRA